jgi:uncharacterized protein (TIGR03067 family)
MTDGSALARSPEDAIMRPLALCSVAALSLAFAPAPLPRPQRGREGDDLARLQGVWENVNHNGRPYPQGRDLPEVKGDVWRHNTPLDSWTITLDPHSRPKRIDLHGRNDKGVFFRGIYKIEGDTFTYSLRRMAQEHERPESFEPHPEHAPWVSVFKRRK